MTTVRRVTIRESGFPGRPTFLLRAIIFDFDGILVDSEPLIMNLFQEMAAREGWALSEEEYYRDYLALDDRAVIEHLYRTHGRSLSIARRDELLAWKVHAYEKIIQIGRASCRERVYGTV